MIKGNLLFEIGVEEIPARFIPTGISQLKEGFNRVFSEYRIETKDLQIFATPRRFALIASVSSGQIPEEKLIWGPPAYIAFDDKGKPKEAAIAFAKSQGVAVESLKIKSKGKGRYVCAVLSEKGRSTEEILPDILKKLFFSLSFPKMMRWGSGSLKFIRPVRWLLALYNDKLISFEIDGITTERKTYGHRFFSKAPLNITKIEDYEDILERAFVIVDHERRKTMIVKQAEEIVKNIDGKILWNKDLLEEVNYLVEYPRAVLGSFPEGYLTLPEELLITVMKDHQRYFAVTDSGEKLKNYFVVVGNTTADNDENIRKGAERVIKARFEDARFYYEEDLKKGMDNLVEATKRIVYHKELGSLYDKTLRIMNIAERIAEEILPEKKQVVITAAKYCKADLAGGVIREFPELQGIMGGYYVSHAGLSEEVAIAIKEQYLPKTFSDEIPSTDAGCILSIADRIDHIASFFFLGEIPTGTEDPFGLRRAANAIVAILLKKKYPLSISEVVNCTGGFVDEDTKKEITIFITQRVESYFEISGYDVNTIRTVYEFIPRTPLYEIKKRLDAVKDFQKTEDFESFFFAVKRVSNIIKNYEKIELKPELFVTEEEKKLYEAMLNSKKNLDSYISKEQFLEALNHLNNLTLLINKFFDRVLVMEKEERLRMNRLALLQKLAEILKSVADLSKLY